MSSTNTSQQIETNNNLFTFGAVSEPRTYSQATGFRLDLPSQQGNKGPKKPPSEKKKFRNIQNARQMLINLEKSGDKNPFPIRIQTVTSICELASDIKKHHSNFSFHVAPVIDLNVPGTAYLFDSSNNVYPFEGFRRITTDNHTIEYGTKIQKTDIIGFIVPL